MCVRACIMCALIIPCANSCYILQIIPAFGSDDITSADASETRSVIDWR